MAFYADFAAIRVSFAANYADFTAFLWRFYDKLFRKSKGGNALEEQNNKKITDKAFTRFVATSVFGILVCIACLCSSTFAWFTTTQDSSQNTITSGTFDHEIKIEITSAGSGETIAVTDGAVQSCTLDRGKSYVVTLTPTDTTTVKGYCVITIDGMEYHTGTYGAVSEGSLEVLTFTLTLPAGNVPAEVIFKPHWGIAAEKHVQNGETLTHAVVAN